MLIQETGFMTQTCFIVRLTPTCGHAVPALRFPTSKSDPDQGNCKGDRRTNTFLFRFLVLVEFNIQSFS